MNLRAPGNANDRARRVMHIALTGDVMLGRMVNETVVENRAVRPEALWGSMLPVMRRADCRLINLECVISDRGAPWHPATKAFHFRAGPRAVDVLRAAGIDGVMLANNHVLDYGQEAFLDCLRRLNGAALTRAGPGRVWKRRWLRRCSISGNSP